MKKRSVFFSFLLFLAGMALTSAAQEQPASSVPVDPDTKKITYREVVNENGTPGYLYDKGIEWFRYYYVNPISVYNVQDRTNARIEGTGRIKLYYFEPDGTRREGVQIQYAIRMEFKDNRYRYTITDFLLKTASRYPLENWLNKADPSYNPQWDAYLYQIDTTMVRLVATMKEKMKPTVQKTDEW